MSKYFFPDKVLMLSSSYDEATSTSSNDDSNSGIQSMVSSPLLMSSQSCCSSPSSLSNPSMDGPVCNSTPKSRRRIPIKLDGTHLDQNEDLQQKVDSLLSKNEKLSKKAKKYHQRYANERKKNESNEKIVQQKELEVESKDLQLRSKQREIEMLKEIISTIKESENAKHAEEITKQENQFRDLKKTLECVVCKQGYCTVTLIPCKHQVLCLECSDKLESCPFCRMNIQAKMDNITNFAVKK